MKRVLITGGSGFVGAPTARILVARGYEVHAVCTRPGFVLDGAKIHNTNILEHAQIDAIIDTIQPDTLLHLAWITTPGVYMQSVLNLSWTRAGLYLLERFVQSGGKRASLVGTCFEYDLSCELLQEEVTPEKPDSLYGSAKLSLSILSRAYAAQVGLSLVCPRLFYLFGECEAPARAVPYAILAALRDEPIKCMSPDAIRDYMPENEAARALCDIIESDVCGVVNVAGGEGLTMHETFSFIAQKTDASNRLVFGDIPAKPAAVVGDTQKLRNAVGFFQRESWQEGILRCIDWWKENGGKYGN